MGRERYVFYTLRFEDVIARRGEHPCGIQNLEIGVAERGQHPRIIQNLENSVAERGETPP